MIGNVHFTIVNWTLTIGNVHFTIVNWTYAKTKETNKILNDGYGKYLVFWRLQTFFVPRAYYYIRIFINFAP